MFTSMCSKERLNSFYMIIRGAKERAKSQTCYPEITFLNITCGPLKHSKVVFNYFYLKSHSTRTTWQTVQFNSQLGFIHWSQYIIIIKLYFGSKSSKFTVALLVCNCLVLFITLFNIVPLWLQWTNQERLFPFVSVKKVWSVLPVSNHYSIFWNNHVMTWLVTVI